MSNKILTQGIFDGLCLQYAVMNAFKALKAPELSSLKFSKEYAIKWQKVIAITPSLQNFSSGIGSDFGVDLNKTSETIMANLIRSYFEAIGEKTNFNYSVDKLSVEQIINCDFSKSVLIFCLKEQANTEQYSDANHWVCAIGIDDGYFLLACPHVIYERADEIYLEQISKTSGRYFNNRIYVSEIQKKHIYESSIFRISIEKHR